MKFLTIHYRANKLNLLISVGVELTSTTTTMECCDDNKDAYIASTMASEPLQSAHHCSSRIDS